MKKPFRFLSFALMLLATTSLGLTFSSCDEETLNELLGKQDEELCVYPWVDYPRSYIKFFDYRMQFRLLNVQRNGSALQIDYTLTNVGFGRDVTLVFYLDREAGHDDLGNTYCSAVSQSDIIASINGATYSIYGNGKSVNFMPNQTIRGSFTIKNFDINALAFSMSTNVKLTQPANDITLAYERLDFVNIPVEALGEEPIPSF